MSKHLFANEKVMTQYLGALLCEDEPTDQNLEPVAKLLEQVKEPETKTEEIRLVKQTVRNFIDASEINH